MVRFSEPGGTVQGLRLRSLLRGRRPTLPGRHDRPGATCNTADAPEHVRRGARRIIDPPTNVVGERNVPIRPSARPRSLRLQKDGRERPGEPAMFIEAPYVRRGGRWSGLCHVKGRGSRGLSPSRPGPYSALLGFVGGCAGPNICPRTSPAQYRAQDPL